MHVSVLMPTYEPNPEHLADSLNSLISQTHTDWSLLIHDDASKADVRSMIEPFLKDDRITFARSKNRLGIGGNWNVCLQAAKGPIVQFWFQDDTWDADYLKKGVEVLRQHPSVGIVSIEHRYSVEGKMETDTLYEELKKCKKQIVNPGVHEGKAFLRHWIELGLHPNIIGEPSFVMLRKELTEKAGAFLENMRQFLDSEYWTRCLLHSDLYYIPEELGSFRVHAEAASARNFESGAGIFDRLLTFEHLQKNTNDASLKTQIRFARKAAVKNMAKKFLKRRKEKQSTGGSLKMFFLRHPVLAVKVLWDVMM